MSRVWVECWQCDECGHTWIRSWDGKTPEQCASSKCRKRSWNKDQVFVPDDPTSDADVKAAQEASRIARALSEAELTPPGLEEAAVDPEPICMACDGSMVEGRGKSAGLWACQDKSCSRYGIGVRR
jgi:hypothetical protein